MVSKAATGALLAAASAVAYGSLVVLAKLAYAEGWNVPSLLVARFALAALTVAPFALARGASWKGFGGAFLVGAVGYAGTTALYFPSIRLLPSAVAAFLLYLAPPIIGVVSWLIFRERLGARGWGAMALAVAGLALLSSGAFRGALPWTGVLLATGSALVYSFTVLGSRHLVADLAWPRATLGVALGALASYLVFSLSTGMLAVPPSVPGFVYAALIGTLATGIALSLFMAALPRIGASRTALISTLEPVSTLVIAAVVLVEVPSWTSLAGGALIVVAAALAALARPEELTAPAPRE